jgi:hypothetical protein
MFGEHPTETPGTAVSCDHWPAVQRLERALEQLQADLCREVGYWKSQHANAVKRVGLDAICGCPAHSDGQQRIGASGPRPCGGAQKLLRLNDLHLEDVVCYESLGELLSPLLERISCVIVHGSVIVGAASRRFLLGTRVQSKRNGAASRRSYGVVNGYISCSQVMRRT